MRPFVRLLGMLLVLTASVAVANVHVVVVGNSEDSWERPRDESIDCDPVSAERVFLVQNAQAAVRRLDDASLVALTDEDARAFLSVVSEPTYTTLSQQLLTARIAGLIEQRRFVHEQRIGSWSRNDDDTLASLENLLENLSEHPVTPYLVRALAADADQVSRFDVWSCNDTVLTRSYPTLGTGTRGRPDRMALVVLLTGSPRDAVPEWTYDDPDHNH